MSIQNLSVSDLIYQMRLERGLVNEYNEPEITVTPKRDFWQEGLQQEYHDQMKLQSMMGNY